MSYQEIMRFIENETGISLKPVNMMTFNSFLDDRIKDFNGSPIVYLNILKTVREEYERLLDYVTINETYFFREEKHFKFLKEIFIHERFGNSEPMNFWSASCSSGEEPLSLYALLNKRLHSPFKIFASDINTHILQKFKGGRYRQSSKRTDGKPFHHYLDSIFDQNEGDSELTIRDDVIGKIDIRQINLYSDSFADLPQMDVIFLRNTLIYMNTANKQTVINKIIEKLNIGGILLLSSSEVAHISHPQLEVVSSPYCYYLRKKNPLHIKDQKPNFQLQAVSHAEPEPDKTKDAGPIQQEDRSSVEVRPVEREVCLFITNILNNPIFEEKDTPALRSAQMFVRILSEMNENNLLEAETLLEKLDPDQHPQSLYHFFKGFIPLQKGDRSNAMVSFQKALTVNSYFWPARYYLVFNCNGGTKGEKEHLQNLMKHIDQYIEEKRIDYQFLLEGFNAKYFRDICRARMERLEKGFSYGN